MKIGQATLGKRAQSTKSILHGRGPAAPHIWSTGLGGNIRQNMSQEILSRVQRLIKIKKAKAYRTVSNEALCIITGVKIFHIKIFRGKRQNKLQIDQEKTPKQWLHSPDRTIATDLDKKQEEVAPINICTEGSNSVYGVGAGIDIKTPGTQPLN